MAKLEHRDKAAAVRSRPMRGKALVRRPEGEICLTAKFTSVGPATVVEGPPFVGLERHVVRLEMFAVGSVFQRVPTAHRAPHERLEGGRGRWRGRADPDAPCFEHLKTDHVPFEADKGALS